MSEEYSGGFFREVKVGRAIVRRGEVIIPKKAKIVGYFAVSNGLGFPPTEYIIYVEEKKK